MVRNEIELVGTVTQRLELSHEFCGEKFYSTTLSVMRSSGNVDEIPLIISERICTPQNDILGKNICVTGNVRTYNLKENNHSKLKVFVFIDTLDFLDIYGEYIGVNTVCLAGYLCKISEPRQTPLGRTICDAILAVNRKYGKSDYIPIILWNKNAYFAQSLAVGDNLEIEGRIQSRTYTKNNEECNAYEISVQTLAIVNDDLIK